MKLTFPAVFKRFSLLSALLLLAACGQNEGGPVRPAAAPSTEESQVHGSMTAVVEHASWTAGGSPAETKLEDVTANVNPNGIVTISGRRFVYHALKADYMEEIAVSVRTLSEGEYKLEPDFNNLQTATFTKGLDSANTFFIQANQVGTATISRIDTATHRIFGTFEFSAKDAHGRTVDVQNGAFDNVRYQ